MKTKLFLAFIATLLLAYTLLFFYLHSKNLDPLNKEIFKKNISEIIKIYGQPTHDFSEKSFIGYQKEGKYTTTHTTFYFSNEKTIKNISKGWTFIFFGVELLSKKTITFSSKITNHYYIFPFSFSLQQVDMHEP